MKVLVNEETFWALRGNDSLVYYVENDTDVELYMPRQGHFICSSHIREDMMRDEETAENPNMYLVWKQEKLDGCIRVLKVRETKTVLEVRQ